MSFQTFPTVERRSGLSNRCSHAADIVFGNCEGVYSDRPARSPSHKHFMGAPRERGAMLGDVGFDVMTCANNHMVDGGYAGLEDTLELLREQGIAVTGAGADITEATRPAIVERDGLRVAFLGFCSVYPVGYEARADRPGIAPAASEDLLCQSGSQLLGAGHRSPRSRPRPCPRTSSAIAP